MDPLTMAAISAGATAAKAGLQAIPTKFERDQKKRLKELQRKQEMGLLGLTEAERAQIESQLRAPREQAQRRSDAEIARLSTPTAQSGQQLLAAQLGAEGRQRMEADLASQLLGMDIQRQREQEADIAAMEAGQGLKQDEMRASLAAIPMAGAEAYIGQMGLEQLINVSNMTPEQRNTYLKNDLQLDDTETSLLQLDEVVDPRIVPTSQQADGLFPQGGTMPQLQSPQRQVDGLFPQGMGMPQLQSNYDNYDVANVRRLLNDPNIPDNDALGIQRLYQYYVDQGLQTTFKLSMADVAKIYYNLPRGTYTDRQYNQSMNIPSNQVSMINQTAFPALEGRINVTNKRGQEI
jgi:hypothetical protein